MSDDVTALAGLSAQHLTAFEVTRSRGFADLSAGLARVFPTPATSLAPIDPDPAVPSSTLHAVRLSDMTIGVAHLASALRADVGPMSGHQVAIALRGGVVGHFPGGVVKVDSRVASINCAGQGAVLPRWDAGTTLLILRIRPSAVSRELRELVGHSHRGRLRFDHEFRLDTAAGRSWLRLLGALLADLDEPGSLSRGSALHRSRLESLVISSLLRATENDFTRSEAVGPGRPVRASVRRVVEAMEDDPSRHWTLSELATLGGVGSRRLQQAFAEQQGVSPFGYLQRLRLDGARRELLEGTLPVGVVAARWGFVHLGRFASAYRARFGEAPSETRGWSRSIVPD